MIRFVILSLLVLGSGLVIGLVQSSQIFAADDWVDASISNSQAQNFAQARDYVNNLCADPNYNAYRADNVHVRAAVAVAAYPSDARFNTATGQMTYTANLVWRSCSDDSNRAFAIIGYPNQGGAGSLATCPDAGTYALPNTYDCIKYTRASAGHFSGWSGLNCPAGSNYACVTGGSNPGGLFVSVIERIENQPSTAVQSASQAVTSSTVPDWGERTKTSGSYSFERPHAFCTYYKWVPGGISHWANCFGLRIDVSWTRYNYNLIPNITSPVNGSTIESDSGDTTVTGTVVNEGPTSSRDTDWQLTQLRYPASVDITSIPSRTGGDGASRPCDYFTGEIACTELNTANQTYSRSGDTHSATASIGTNPLGTKICYSLSVRPYNQTTSDWRHSALSCYIISKKPKVQILGGDLWVGRGLNSSGNSYTSQVITSTSRVAGESYGSWSEYGIVTPTTIRGMASGAGYSGGALDSNYCTVSLLTFANTTSSGTCDRNNVGGYKIASSQPTTALISTLSSRPTIPITGAQDIQSLTSGTVYTATGDITLSASAPVPKGKWVVISAPGRTVTISGSITYQDVITKSAGETSFALLGLIPQVVIIAGNIVIQDSVTQVDAWLVATDTIRTCQVTNLADLGGDVCSNRLTVNGPVIADRLLLYRTAGAGTGSAAGEPAEVFNLRPDAYLWATALQNQTTRVKTVQASELPPRY